MLISYRWLNDLFPTDLLPEAIAEKLTGIGHAVDGLEALGDDWIIDLDLTSNRPDCLSHLGIARELAASLNTKLSANKRLSRSNLEALPYPAILAPEVVKIEAPDLCHRFTARIIRGVKVGPSPDWLKRRLESVGERSINNIADITNYVMLELGQPMHAFDLDKLSGSKIIVRRARPGEKLKTLDGVERLLDEDILCVCDDEKPAAIAGIMGGEYSSITDATVNVLLEVAYFLPGVVRQGSRSLNLRSEASNRFERGVDIENIENASQRATDMILDLAGGEAADLIDIYPNRHSPKTVCAPDLSESVKRLTSITVSEQECIEILGNLGIEKSQENDCYHIPSWRYDISIEEDLVEEVARITGYDKVRDELPPALHSGEYLPNEDFRRAIRSTLSVLGFNECLTYSFINSSLDEKISYLPKVDIAVRSYGFVSLRDSVIEGANRMRASIVPGLLSALEHNFTHGNRDAALFEIGKVFAANKIGELPLELSSIALALMGGQREAGRLKTERQYDFYDIKGAVEAVLDCFCPGRLRFIPCQALHLAEGQSAEVYFADQKIGYLGKLNDDLLGLYKMRGPVFVAELDLDFILQAQRAQYTFTELPKFPPVVRDATFLVRPALRFSDIAEFSRKEGGRLLSEVGYMDDFRKAGQRALTLRFMYRAENRTLTESEVDNEFSALIAKIEQQFAIQRQ